MNQIITSFNAGEISPYLDARSDLEKYNSGCRLLENFIIMPYGGVFRRPGTEYLGAAKLPDKPCRLIGFNFSTTQSLVIELGHEYMRFWRDGAPVLKTGVPYEVASPYLEPHLREVQYIQINDVVFLTHPLYEPYKLSRYGDSDWTMGPVGWDWPAFLDENVSNITLTPSANTGTTTLTASAPAWATGKAFQVGDAVLEGSLIYTAQVEHTSTTFAADLSALKWKTFEVFTPGNADGFFQIGHTRPQVYVEQRINANVSTTGLTILGGWEFTTYGTWTAIVKIERSYDGFATYEAIRTYDSNNDRNVSTTGNEEREAQLRIKITGYSSNSGGRALLEASEARQFGFVKITEVTNSRTAIAEVRKDLFAATSTNIWSEGAWSNRRGFPPHGCSA